MLLPVMQHVAPLAEGLEVSRAAVAGIMVEVRRREIDGRGCALPRVNRQARKHPALPTTPVRPLLVVPSTVAKMADLHTMRRLENVRGEFNLTALAYNIRRAIILVRVPGLGSGPFTAWA